MNLLVVALIISAIFLAITAAIARRRPGAGGVALFSVVAFFVSAMLNSEVLLTQSALTFVLALIFTAARSKPKVMILASLAAAATSFGFAGLTGYADHRSVEALRAQYPLTSVAGRLAYEPQATMTSSPLPLSSQVERRLSQTENRETPGPRQTWLRILHESKSNQFKRALGFGSGRMISITGRRIEENVVLPDSEPIPAPVKPEPSSDTGSPEPFEIDQRDALFSLRWSGQEDFLDPERIGYVQDRDHVAGFVSHRFTSLPPLSSDKQAKTEWQLTRLELLSLLKHDLPVAYVSDHLPQMDELRDAPTRPLDDFERQALERLRSDEDLLIDDGLKRIRRVGSLRAGKDCLECHSVRRGELLGAFSYELVRPVPVKPSEVPGA